MRLFTPLTVSILWFAALASGGGSDDKCAQSITYSCPSDLCNGTILVSDCLDCDGYLNTDAANDQCFDRKLLNGKKNPSPGYLYRDIAGIIIWFCAAGVATACGVGGGGIYVPLGILLLAFAPKPSSGLSQASIFGASLGGLLLNLPSKHPFSSKVEKGGGPNGADALASVPTADKLPTDTDQVQHYTRPLIDYDMALFLAPMEMAGAVLGVIIQKILPNWLYLTLAAIILGFTSRKTFAKYFDTKKKEDAAGEAAAAAAAEQEKPAAEEQALMKGQEESGEEVGEKASETQKTGEEPDLEKITPDPIHATAEISGIEDGGGAGAMDPEKVARREELLRLDARQYPKEKLGALLVLWIGLILLTFFKGGKGVDSIVGITCASSWYGILIAIQFLWTLGFAVRFALKLMKDTEEKKSVGYPFHPQDVLWDASKTRFYAFFTLVAGIVAGLIGIGGGMVLGPLMLVMGIHPRVSTATTATMIVLTSSSVAVLFVTAGLVPWEYAVCFFCVCFSGALVGKTKIDRYVKKTGKASILILLLATIIALATLGAVIIVLLRLAAADWCFAGFNKFCSLPSEDNDDVQCPVERLLFGPQKDIF